MARLLVALALCTFLYLECCKALGPSLIGKPIFGLSPSKAAAVTSIALAVSFPAFGNIGDALTAVVENPDSALCTLDTQTADEYHGSCQLLKKVVRWRAGKLMTIKQDWGGSASTGAAVWNGANMAGWYMENGIGRENMKGKSVLELGAGVGFTSLIANALGAADVVITDGNEDVLKLADENIDTNVAAEDRSKIRTARLRWNTDDEASFKEKSWDYIFAADVTYLKKNRPDLMASIAHLSGPNTVTFLSMEPRNVGEVEDVLALAEKNGLKWKEEKLPIDPIKEGCSLLCARMFSLTKTTDL